MKIAVAGSRNFVYLEWVDELIALLPSDTIIVSGGANGVDQRAETMARLRGLECVIYKPDWSMGRSAGMMRNRTIVDESDLVVAFWDAQSSGTKHAITYAQYKHKPTYVIVDLESKRSAFTIIGEME